MVRLSPKVTVLLLYVFVFLLLFSQIFSQVPINEVTMPNIVLLTLIFVVGLVFVLGWDYIIPKLVPSFKIGECHVKDGKYIICRYRGSAELIGYTMLKVVPMTPIADMDKERRESMLQTIQGMLRGAQYEVVVAFVGMKDRYHENIIKRLEDEKQRHLMFAGGRETPMTRDIINRIDTELRILRQVPFILEGFYIALVREYDTDEYRLVSKLENDARGLMSTLEAFSAETRQVSGEELKNLASYLLFGSVVQMTM